MVLPRTLLPFLMVALLAAFVGACGSSDSATSRGGGDSARSDDPEPGTVEANRQRAAASGFAITPELTSCMNRAGFSQDPVAVEGGVVSWRSDEGGRVVVAQSSETALGVASEIGTASEPASVDGERVTTGPAAQVAAAGACLDAASR